MKKRIVIILVLIILTLLIIGAFKINEEKKEAINKQRELTRELQQLKEETNEQVDEARNCEFTKTLLVVNLLDYKIDEGSTFIVVDQFQLFSPFILKIPNSVAEVIETNNYYEFIFKGKTSYSDYLTDYNILNIKPTDKLGLDQIQEQCE